MIDELREFEVYTLNEYELYLFGCGAIATFLNENMQPEDIPALVRDLVDPETIAALKVAVAEAEPSTH